MSPVSIAFLAISLSIDSFVASLGNGAGQARSTVPVLRNGTIFGVAAVAAALIGSLLGAVASGLVQIVDHWIAFALLGGVGVHMLLSAAVPGRETKSASVSTRTTIATAIGASVDVMAVGVSLALIESRILAISIVIGLASMGMSMAGAFAGGLMKRGFGRIAEAIGGLTLFALGLAIFVDHIS